MNKIEEHECEIESVEELIFVLGFKKFATKCVNNLVWENMSEFGKENLAVVLQI